MPVVCYIGIQLMDDLTQLPEQLKIFRPSTNVGSHARFERADVAADVLTDCKGVVRRREQMWLNEREPNYRCLRRTTGIDSLCTGYRMT